MKREEHTRQRDIALVGTSISPLEYTNALVQRESPAGILQRNHTLLLSWRKLENIRVVLELQMMSAKVRRWVRQQDLDMRKVGVGNLKIHIALKLHRLYASVAMQRKTDLFFDNDMNTRVRSTSAAKIELRVSAPLSLHLGQAPSPSILVSRLRGYCRSRWCRYLRCGRR